jgi:hypothetical protein
VQGGNIIANLAMGGVLFLYGSDRNFIPPGGESKIFELVFMDVESIC